MNDAHSKEARKISLITLLKFIAQTYNLAFKRSTKYAVDQFQAL